MTFAPVRLRTLLSLLALSAVLPPILLLVFALWRAGSADQAATESQFVAQARNLATIFSSALDANIAVVRRMAVLDSQSPEVLTASAGYPQVEFSIEALTTPHTDELGWHLSNLFDVVPGTSAKLTVSVDLDHEEGNASSLQLTMDPRDLVGAIRFNPRLFEDTTVAVVDGEGRIIARSDDEDRHIGALVPNWNALLAVGESSGIIDAVRLEGDPITFGFALIPGTPGWAVVVGIPASLLEARWSEPTRILAIVTVIAILMAILLAWFVASRINRPIAALVDYAGRADPSAKAPARSPIAEFETLRRSLVVARTALLDRARRDDLTGLPNRVVLRERLTEAVSDPATADTGALLYIDLDRFKQANDTYGHHVGDAVLRLVADRMRAVLRPEDLAARIGGDEFAVVVSDVARVEDVLPIATRLIAEMHLPFEVEGARIHLGASAGIVMIGADAGSVDELVRRADTALYDAKSAGRGRYSIYGLSPERRLIA
jgi:diguanylate cyclase (GGDEF)-like protein